MLTKLEGLPKYNPDEAQFASVSPINLKILNNGQEPSKRKSP